MRHPDRERVMASCQTYQFDAAATTHSRSARTVRSGNSMNHHQLESALDHLEHVLARISGTDHIPLSYWRKRIDDVSAAARIPAQKSRARRLDEALSVLESRTGA
jgi:hypothetical protein